MGWLSAGMLERKEMAATRRRDRSSCIRDPFFHILMTRTGFESQKDDTTGGKSRQAQASAKTDTSADVRRSRSRGAIRAIKTRRQGTNQDICKLRIYYEFNLILSSNSSIFSIVFFIFSFFSSLLIYFNLSLFFLNFRCFRGAF